MKEITAAITARHAQIRTLQADIDALQRAASIMGGENAVTATRQPKTTSTPTSKAQPKPKPKRRPMTAAQRAAVGKRMKASWAKRKKASAAVAGTPTQPTTT